MRIFALLAAVALIGCSTIKTHEEPKTAVVEAGPVEVKPAPVLVEKQEPFIVPEQKPESVAIVEEKPVVAVDSTDGQVLSLVFALFLCTLAIVIGVWTDYKKKIVAAISVLPTNEEKPEEKPSDTADK